VKFTDRAEAGRVLAEKLQHYAGRSNVLVLALPRGGVPVAFEVARALDAPLDIFVVRKLGVPGHEEYAMGALAAGGVRVINGSVIEELHIPPSARRWTRPSARLHPSRSTRSGSGITTSRRRPTKRCASC
jgi:predicted phosphoribosyltransferase